MNLGLLLFFRRGDHFRWNSKMIKFFLRIRILCPFIDNGSKTNFINTGRREKKGGKSRNDRDRFENKSTLKCSTFCETRTKSDHNL